KAWLRDDARLFLQIRNSIDSEVISLVNHCEFVKELMDYLEFLYSGKGNIVRIYEVCKSFYRAEQHDNSLTSYFMIFKKTFEKLNALLPLNPNVKVQQVQREQLAIMSFLAGLRKSLYGLKQSSRAWFGKFSQAVENFGMKKSKFDHSVFYKQSASGIIILI